MKGLGFRVSGYFEDLAFGELPVSGLETLRSRTVADIQQLNWQHWRGLNRL